MNFLFLQCLTSFLNISEDEDLDGDGVPNEEDDDLDGDGKINHGGLTDIFLKAKY